MNTISQSVVCNGCLFRKINCKCIGDGINLQWCLEQIENDLLKCYSPATNSMNRIRHVQYIINQFLSNEGGNNAI